MTLCLCDGNHQAWPKFENLRFPLHICLIHVTHVVLLLAIQSNVILNSHRVKLRLLLRKLMHLVCRRAIGIREAVLLQKFWLISACHFLASHSLYWVNGPNPNFTEF